ncbi:hypothetical protein GTP45_01245 [Pseudoduganella sp. FT55W]|uniref:KOW domain-containing protein n=1 Tax=Duganella rivi TaxID=2666083 RepID=A0A7X4GL40_9BURK|nr:hypothetical protein [Duganella rivi]MYM65458.1 hypothetical protein [Duganella rivi]
MQKFVNPGDTVSFDSDAGKKIGTVDSIVTDITNGAKVATVRLPCGGTTALPINHLRQEANQ